MSSKSFVMWSGSVHQLPLPIYSLNCLWWWRQCFLLVGVWVLMMTTIRSLLLTTSCSCVEKKRREQDEILLLSWLDDFLYMNLDVLLFVWNMHWHQGLIHTSYVTIHFFRHMSIYLKRHNVHYSGLERWYTMLWGVFGQQGSRVRYHLQYQRSLVLLSTFNASVKGINPGAEKTCITMCITFLFPLKPSIMVDSTSIPPFISSSFTRFYGPFAFFLLFTNTLFTLW